MNRRDFLKTGALAAVALPLAGSLPASAAPKPYEELPGADLRPSAGTVGIRFLGTGAADWKGPDDRGEHRRRCSILVNGKFLIDYTACNEDMLPQGCRPEVIFYTHSHGDHYNAEDALKLGIKKVYLSETWLARAQKEFRAASLKYGIPAPEIVPMKEGGRYEQDGLVITALPGNHVTGDMQEQALIYLIESTDARVLYATDTAGIMGKAARFAGIDYHVAGKAIHGIVMEATMGLGHDNDFRIFNHSSVATVVQTVKVLRDTRRYTPRAGKKVYITHLARTLHGTQAQLDRELPSPLKAAYDGLEIEF